MSRANYEIHVRGRLSPAVRASFGNLTSSEKPVETVLQGPIRDAAELYATLARIQSLGLELLELRRIPDVRELAGVDGGEPESPAADGY